MINKGPLWNFTFLLSAYTLVTLLLHLDSWVYFSAVALLMGTAFGVMRLLKKQSDAKNFIISGCILYLLYNPASTQMEYGILALIVALFTLSKYVRYQTFPYVNPIVFAILGSHALLAFFGHAPLISWWGAAYMGSWSLLWLAPAVVYGVYTFRRQWLVLSYIISYSALSTLVGDIGLLFTLGTGTIYFVTGIMLLEPKTSPITRTDQLLFGVGTAILTFFLPHITDNFILGIALMNVAFVLKKKQADTP